MYTFVRLQPNWIFRGFGRIGHMVLLQVLAEGFPLEFLGIHCSDRSQIGYLELLGSGADDIRI